MKFYSMVNSLKELIKDGFMVVEDHDREPIPNGTIGDYVVIETPDKKRYLTKKDSDTYIEVVYEDGR